MSQKLSQKTLLTPSGVLPTCEDDDDDDGIDPLMPGLLPAGQVGSLEDGYSTSDDGSDDDYPDLPELVTTDDESDDNHPDAGSLEDWYDTPWPPHDGYSTSDGESRPQGRGESSSRTGSLVLHDDDDDGDGDGEDRPPGLLSTEDSGADTGEDSWDDEVLYSRQCLACPFVCRCPVDVSSS